MPTEQQGSTSAKILYRPLGITSSIIGGIIAGQVFKQVWKHATPGRAERRHPEHWSRSTGCARC